MTILHNCPEPECPKCLQRNGSSKAQHSSSHTSPFVVGTSGDHRSGSSGGRPAIAATSSRHLGGDDRGGGGAAGRFSRGSLLRGRDAAGTEVGREGDAVLFGAGRGVEALDGIMSGLSTSGEGMGGTYVRAAEVIHEAEGAGRAAPC